MRRSIAAALAAGSILLSGCATPPPPQARLSREESERQMQNYRLRIAAIALGGAGAAQSPAPVSAPAQPASPAAAPPAPAAARSDIDELPSSARPRRAGAHAVVIGVRRYRQKLPSADYADDDARLVSRYLTQIMGYQPANVATLVDDEAAKSDFEKYFEQWLPNRVQSGDEVFVYYSGHGAPNPQTGDAYLVPYDGDPTYLKQTAYPLDRLYAELGKLPAARVTVVMDSCFSGGGGRSVIAAGARPLVTVKTAEALPVKVSVLSASASDQISRGYDLQRHGLFTYFLLKAIKEQAAQGGVDIHAAFEGAAPQVRRVARQDYNADQEPQWRDGR